MQARTLAGAVVAAAAFGLLIPSVGQASEPSTHNGVGSLKHPATAAPTTGAGALAAITFDPGTAPCTFDLTEPLRHEYEAMGVHFSGPTEETGGAILNECGGFGIDARSGDEFLAFATFSYAVTPEHIGFDDLQKKVTLYAANGGGDGTSTFTVEAFRDGDRVDRKSISTAESGWTKVKVAKRSGIDEIVLTATTPDGGFAVDDLTFKPR